MPEPLQVIAPDPHMHGEQILDLACKCFGGYFSTYPHFKTVFLTNNHYSFEHSRIGVVDGKVVTHFGVFDYQTRVGEGRLRTAGIGYVATHGDYRKRGFMAQTARNCLAGLTQNHFHFSLLFGLENFYEQFGYTRAWSETLYTASLEKFAPAGKPPRFKTLPFEQINNFHHLHTRHHAPITGSAVRPTYRTWGDTKRYTLLGWNGAGNKPAGYLVAQDAGNHVGIAEAVGDPEAILHAAHHLAGQFACDEIRFPLISEQSALARRLCQGNIQLQVRYIRNGGAVGRLLDVPATFGAVLPELSRRVENSPLKGYRGDLQIVSAPASVTLRIRGGGVTLQKGKAAPAHRLTAGVELSQLILGTDEPGNVMESAGMRVTGDARMLISILFPAQHPMLGALDRF